MCSARHVYLHDPMKGAGYVCAWPSHTVYIRCGAPITVLQLEAPNQSILLSIIRLGGSDAAKQFLKEIGYWKTQPVLGKK